LKIVVVFQRCNPEGVNCEYFQSWSMSDLCPKLRDKNQIWSSWYGAFDPQPSCPVKKVRNNHPYNILIVLNNSSKDTHFLNYSILFNMS